MPNVSSPSRQLVPAVQDIQNDKLAQSRGQNAFDGITDEVVETVFGNGLLTIQGQGEHLTTTGIAAPIQPGDSVRVGWRRGVPVVILSHTAQRGKFVPTFGGARGIVEELFVVDESSPAIIRQVWFRNVDQFVPIQFILDNGNSGNDPIARGLTAIASVQWGLGDADYFTVSGPNVTSETIILVYRLQRPRKNEPFSQGQKVKAKLVRAYNLSTDPFTFGTLTMTGANLGLSQSGSITGPLKYIALYSAPAGPGPTDSPVNLRFESVLGIARVAPNGDLLVPILVRGQAATGQTGQTSVEFDFGSLLVNVTRSLVLQNRLGISLAATVYVTPTSPPPTCTPIATVNASVSLGGLNSSAGQITLLSLTGVDPLNPADTALTGTFNNYLLLGPAWVSVETVRVEDPPGTIIGAIVCGPPRGDLQFSIIGELAANNTNFASFAGNSVSQPVAALALFQGSRKMVLWVSDRDITTPNALRIRDLVKGVTSSILGNPNSVLGVGSSNPLLFLTQAALVYSPFDSRTPFDHQFFVQGHAADTGIFTINLAALKPISDLKDQAKLAPAKNTRQIALARAGTNIIQVLNSRTNLGSRFKPGPL